MLYSVISLYLNKFENYLVIKIYTFAWCSRILGCNFRQLFFTDWESFITYWKVTLFILFDSSSKISGAYLGTLFYFVVGKISVLIFDLLSTPDASFVGEVLKLWYIYSSKLVCYFFEGFSYFLFLVAVSYFLSFCYLLSLGLSAKKSQFMSW